MKTLPALFLVPTLFALVSCSITSNRDTLAQLKNVKLVLEDATVENGLEKAMDSYRVFLQETPESALTPDAIRRIADLSIEKEYGYIAEERQSSTVGEKQFEEPGIKKIAVDDSVRTRGMAIAVDEGEKEFEERATQNQKLASNNTADLTHHPAGGSDLDNASARQAIELYQKLLKEYPLYDRNDQVLYQMSRAYEELGEVENAMKVMNQFIATYPDSRYLDEIQFRRAEFYFTRKKYLDAEEAYQSIVKTGETSYYYELALYKLGWTFYKQQLYDEALTQYFALLDYKVSIGYDFDAQPDPIESKRVEDTFRVISLSFSNLGGPDVVVKFFDRNGARDYEDKVYSNLGEFYLSKRRYADAAGAYNAFINNHPFHEIAPHFAMRTIEIYHEGRFAQLVIEAKKEFSHTYALDAPYWQYFDISTREDVVSFLKDNLKDLANHYHALFQDKRFAKDKAVNYAEALVWYRNYLNSFPQEGESPAINYQMADLMLENKDFRNAAIAYENTSYNYPLHEQSSEAGYTAVYAYREYLNVVDEFGRDTIKQEVIRTSLKFADTYPEHEKITLVLGAAADDLYEMKNYDLAVATARKLLEKYPNADGELVRSAWLVVAHGSLDLEKFSDAEFGYLRVLELTASKDDSRPDLVDALAASIYKQGEVANKAKDYQTAADHFLRVAKLASTSSIRPNAEYDAATALIELEDWARATDVLLGFRENFPNHEFQQEVTKKVAFVYKSDGKLAQAGAEYERIERESDDDEVRRGALLLAAELYQEAGIAKKELAVYQHFVEYFPSPVESALEIYHKMALVYDALGDEKKHVDTLRKLVSIDKGAGKERTDRTRYLAAQASLVLARPYYDEFVTAQIVEPIQKNLKNKQNLMQEAIDAYTRLLDYGVPDVTAAATYYMAEIYYGFSRALQNSERPKNLNDLELEEYELALEEQIYPFEERGISVHRKNVELLYIGIYSKWIDKSIVKLADVFPALYAREEERTGFVETIDSFLYIIEEPDSNEGVRGENFSAVDEVRVGQPVGVNASRNVALNDGLALVR